MLDTIKMAKAVQDLQAKWDFSEHKLLCQEQWVIQHWTQIYTLVRPWMWSV